MSLWGNSQIPLSKTIPPNQFHWEHDLFSILQDKKGKLWFLTVDGFFIYDGRSIQDGLPGRPVTRIIQDKKGNFWFGVGGLCVGDGKTITRYTTNEALTNDDVWSIFEDDSGNIWKGSRNTQLSKYKGNHLQTIGKIRCLFQ